MASYTEVPVLHEFAFPAACNGLEVTGDQESIVAVGTYTPSLMIYDLLNHAQKCERHTAEETKKLCLVGDDWRKIALLQKGRAVEFHTRFGRHHAIQIPKEGRDIKADGIRAELLVAGKGAQVYRFNMEEGRHYRPIESQVQEIECIAISGTHSLYGVCGAGGAMELVDSRDRTSARATAADEPTQAITACTFSDDGLHFSVGTAEGVVLSYDLRSHTPLLRKDHQYEFPIKEIQYQKKSVLSMDRKGVKVWDKHTGRTHAAVEPGFDTNAFCVSDGLLFVGGDDPRVRSFYVPKLGMIPRWCASLENATEEMAEKSSEAFFTDYRFVSQEGLAALGLEGEVGRRARVYMHGYLVDRDLYNQRHREPGPAPAPSRLAPSGRQGKLPEDKNGNF